MPKSADFGAETPRMGLKSKIIFGGRLFSSDLLKDKTHFKLILGILIVNFTVAVIATQIFSSRYPLGIDTFSHLPKLMHLAESGFASWYYEWYAGYPVFLFYPPLSYLIAYLPTVVGISPLNAYKLTEFVFIMVTPWVFYKFFLRTGASKFQALLGALLFSIIPTTIQNSIFFGRFPNIVSYPFFIATLLYSVDVIKTHSKRAIFFASLFFGLTALTHHLSTYLLMLVLFIYFIGLLFERYSLRQKIIKLLSLSGSLALGILVSSIWVIPFLLYLSYYGITKLNSMEIYLLPLSLASLTIMVSALHVLMRRAYPGLDVINRTMLVWFIVFLILGSNFFPNDYLLPFAQEVDVLRFLLFAAMPGAALIVNKDKYSLINILRRGKVAAATTLQFQTFGITSRLENILSRRKLSIGGIRGLVVLFVILNVIVGAIFLQTQVTLSPYHSVVAQQIYVEDMPREIVEYFRSQDEFGRILPIDIPYWVYLLPHYTDKPLIDGWYPQGIILPTVKGVQTTIDAANNDKLYRQLIQKSQTLGIKWIILSNGEKEYLLEGSRFRLVLETEGYKVYKNEANISYIETKPGAAFEWRQEKDRIIIDLSTSAPSTIVTVKEAYFPAWFASDNGAHIPVHSDKHGFITFILTGAGEHRVVLEFKPYDTLIPLKLRESAIELVKR